MTTRHLLATWLLLSSLAPMAASAQQHEINFVAVSVSGRPVVGQVFQRKGAATPEPLLRLDARGTKKVTDIQCSTGLQFRAEPQIPVFTSPAEWKDCEYGEIRFVFNEVRWRAEYQSTFDELTRLALEGPANVRLEALVAVKSLETREYGTVALAVAQIREKVGDSSPLAKGLSLIEKDSVSRALGVPDGIVVTPRGSVEFSGATVEKFNALTAERNLPFNKLDDPGLKAFIAKEDLLNLKGGLWGFKLPPG